MKVKKSILSALILSFIVGSVSPVFADSSKLKLIRGKNRIETSIIAAREIKNLQIAVIASAYNFADSLSAFNLVSKFRGKLLLVDNKTNISKELNGIRKVYIVGGLSTLNANLESLIKSKVQEVYRISGNNRYETNKATLKEAGFKEVGVADGRNFPDALSASGFLAKHEMGLMLVNGAKDYKSNYPVKYTFGGENSVAYLRGTRIAGKNRYETSEKINSMFNGDLKAIADGSNFADALSAVNITSLGTTNVILAHNNLSNTASSYAKNGKKVYLIGGLLSNDIVNKVYELYGEKSVPTVKTREDEKNQALKVPMPTIGSSTKPETTVTKPQTGSTGSTGSTTKDKSAKEEPKTVKVGEEKTTQLKDNWVKKEQTIREKISEEQRVPVQTEEVPIYEWHESTADKKIDLHKWMEEHGIFKYAPEDPTAEHGYIYAPEYVQFNKDLIANVSEQNKQEFIDKLTNKFGINPELAKLQVQIVVNNKNGTDGNEHKYDDTDMRSQIVYEQQQFLNKGRTDEKGDISMIFIKVQVGTQHVVLKEKVVPAQYKTYKVTWEENSVTHEKRNEVKTEIR